MDQEELTIVKSSLFHDLGKFYMRTHSEDECKSLRKERLTHEDLLNRIKNNIGVVGIDIENDFVKMGDWISSQEREDKHNIDDMEIKEIRKIPLKNIFFLSDKDTKYKYIRPGKISLNEPSLEDFCDPGDGIFEKKIYKDFEKELKKVFERDYIDEKERIRLILDIFKKYLYKIPSSSYYTEPTIDLYNHSRISAAIALSCYRYFKEKMEEFNELKRTMINLFRLKNSYEVDYNRVKEVIESDIYNRKIFLLLEGDISGIQNFISTITTEKALKILRGRSFYIYMVNKMVALKLLKELDLPETNLIYCSGGHFQIICNNSEENKEIAKKIFDEVNRKLFGNFRTKLFFSLSYTEISPRDLSFEDNVNKFFREKNYIFDKNRKFENILKEVVETGNFKIENAGLDECNICKSEIYQKDICDICKEFEDLRLYLKEIQRDKKLKKIKGRYKKIFFFEDFDELFYNGQIMVNDLDNYGMFEILPTGLPLKEDESVKEISELAESNKIAAFKYDIDDLGKILERGPEESGVKQTLSYYARLSFNINLFFEGIVSRIWENKYKDKIIIVYSGGDDGFVIGNPLEVLNFAKDVYNYFKIYTGLSKKFRMSGAYRIFDSKYPVKKIFEILESDLKAAKESREEKNSISINGDIIRWDFFENFEGDIFSDENLDENFLTYVSDFDLMIKFTRYFIKLLKEEKISTSLTHKIMELSKKVVEKVEDNLSVNRKILPNIYILKYLLFRNIDNEIAQKIYDAWENYIFLNNMTDDGMKNIVYIFRSIKLATQFAIFYYRIKIRNEVKKNE